jgi:hypothetical protein
MYVLRAKMEQAVHDGKSDNRERTEVVQRQFLMFKPKEQFKFG